MSPMASTVAPLLFGKSCPGDDTEGSPRGGGFPADHHMSHTRHTGYDLGWSAHGFRPARGGPLTAEGAPFCAHLDRRARRGRRRAPHHRERGRRTGSSRTRSRSTAICSAASRSRTPRWRTRSAGKPPGCRRTAWRRSRRSTSREPRSSRPSRSSSGSRRSTQFLRGRSAPGSSGGARGAAATSRASSSARSRSRVTATTAPSARAARIAARGSSTSRRGTRTPPRPDRPDLVGVDPATAAPGDQDAIAHDLYQRRGNQPWGGRC